MMDLVFIGIEEQLFIFVNQVLFKGCLVSVYY